MIDAILKSIKPISDLAEKYYDNRYMFYVAFGLIVLFVGAFAYGILKLFGVF